jgi:hypothetical protein
MLCPPVDVQGSLCLGVWEEGVEVTHDELECHCNGLAASNGFRN